jgi:outer membrane receptor protein involved in Fe transport
MLCCLKPTGQPASKKPPSISSSFTRYHARIPLTDHWSLEANYTFLGGRDLNPNRNIRRLPPQMGAATLRYVPSSRRAWFEAQLQLAGAQRRLSGGDRDDERIGASRRRRDIADFFNGSRVQPLVRNGVFTPTGETLRQIQDRVLPLGSTFNGVTVLNDDSRVALYPSTAGWAALHLRAGLPLGERWQILTALENALDRNYRFHGSGIDAPGLSAYLGVRWTF